MGFNKVYNKICNIWFVINGIYLIVLWLIIFKMIYKIVGLVYNSICIVLLVIFFYRFGGGKLLIKRVEDL